MPRPDLMALTADDLATLANRGLVKRAQQEMDAGQPAGELTEDEDGAVTAQWSDGAECRLPAGATVAEGTCTCPATTLCRHLIRTVLAYQRLAAAEPGTGAQEEAAVWDPGGIADAEIERQIGKTALARSRKLFEEGQVVTPARGRKPSAIIHTLSCTTRFLVPNELRYTHCDCAEPAPCSHVALAIWAFRRLPPDTDSGLVSTHAVKPPVPEAVLDAVEEALGALAARGIAGAGQTLTDSLRRLEAQTRSAGLIWPAEILAEVVQQLEAYAGHDARFSPVRAGELIGELCVRCDAIRHDTEAVPPLFVRGAATDRATEVGAARLVGLGCGVTVHRGSTEIAAYLQDVDSGTVVAVSRDFANPDAPEPPRSFGSLAQTQVLKGVSLAALGAGQALVKGGKRTPACRFLPGRAPASFQPQAFAWESLRSPLLAEDFAEVHARLSALPPASLRPRRVAQNLFVCPVSGASEARFDPREQAVSAVLTDSSGGRARLSHAYTGRGAAGTETLLSALTHQPDALRFVAGFVHVGPSGLVLEPTALVFERGGVRTAVQPGVDSERAATPTDAPHSESAHGQTPHPWRDFLGQLQEASGETLLLGLEQADARTVRRWQELKERGAALGFARLLSPITALAEALSRKPQTVHWDPAPAADALLRLLVVLDIAGQETIA